MSTANSHDVDAARLRSSSLSSLTSLVGLQLSSRLLTFILNQALFRLASPKAYGVAAIQFELLLSTILFLSREGVRGALLRVGNVTGKKALNVGFVPVLIGIPLALCTSVVYARNASDETRVQPMFVQSVVVYALAAVMELLAEPMHNMAMIELKTGIRVRAEGAGITLKTIVTFLVLLYDYTNRPKRDLALLSFALGQLAYGTCVFVIYAWNYNGRLRFSRASSKSWSIASYFDTDVLSLSITMTSQSLVKHFLTEGDKFILSWFSPLEDQGGYAVAVNYGSLIARIVFQPIEETLRMYFSKTLSHVTSTSSQTEEANPNLNLEQTSQPAQIKPNRSAISEASQTLLTLLHIQLSGSLFLLCFGSQYLGLVLQVFLPKQYLETSAPKILEAWIGYIPVLAVNGGLEAFFASAAGKGDVRRQSGWMLVFSIIYITSAIGLYKRNYGDVSLVYANIINLSARIVYVLNFVASFVRRHGHGAARGAGAESVNWRQVWPSTSLCVALLVSFAVVRGSEFQWRSMEVVQAQGRTAVFRKEVVAHVGTGGLLALICLWVWWKSSLRGVLRLASFRGSGKSKGD
ncbi:Rft-1-domain-containing protein [Marasmius fiardii PR-910]|nr:Rft-1-domain-containing protein [Marasmius fiardii PR-910]